MVMKYFALILLKKKVKKYVTESKQTFKIKALVKESTLGIRTYLKLRWGRLYQETFDIWMARIDFFWRIQTTCELHADPFF